MSGSNITYVPVRSSTGDLSDETITSPSSIFAMEDEGAETLLGQKLQRDKVLDRWRSRKNSTIVITILNVIIFLISLGLFVASRSQASPLNAGLRQASTYSPIFDRLDLEMRSRIIQGTLFPAKDNASIARELPNPVAGELWNEWELGRFYPLTRAEILRMGKDPSMVPKLNDAEWGLGYDAYVGAFDVYHQIHCLNSLRRNAYRGYYNLTTRNHATMGLPEIHINHCVDILLQAMQCSGNVNLMTYDWVAGSINRQCINFEKLTAFRKDKGLDMDKYVQVMKKSLYPGVKERHQSDAYYYWYNETNPNHIDGVNPGEDFNM